MRGLALQLAALLLVSLSMHLAQKAAGAVVAASNFFQGDPS